MGRVVAIVQARLGSKRLPNKVLELIDSYPMLSIVLDKVAQVVGKSNVILAVPAHEWGKFMPYWPKIAVGPTEDVLARFWRVAEAYPEVDTFVRFTSDCPLLDVDFSRYVIDHHLAQPGAHMTVTDRSLDGLDTEVFSRMALAWAVQFATAPFDREHVTPWIRRWFYRRSINQPYLGTVRWSVDDASGLDFARRVYGACVACRNGVPHHTNARGSIGGSDGRSIIVDLHTSEGGGLEECTAADILQERIGPEWAYTL
jgi:spore coat polysaccharide biosynthesis protein SpsF (cytidylyltransferase family)